MLPSRIFLTGVPGSRWSGIAQTLEKLPGFNISDRTPERTYTHHQFTGHLGAYFGRGMELPPLVDQQTVDSAHLDLSGTRIIKSHDWAYMLDEIETKFPNDWIMLVYRPDMSSYAWWHEAGGFQIKYPCYDSYKDSVGMLSEITAQNKAILEYAYKRNASWHYFTEDWIKTEFNIQTKLEKTWSDILVTIIRS